jgi:hypothetical protein
MQNITKIREETGLYRVDGRHITRWVERDEYETPNRRWVVRSTETLQAGSELEHYPTLRCAVAALAHYDKGVGHAQDDYTTHWSEPDEDVLTNMPDTYARGYRATWAALAADDLAQQAERVTGA